MIIGSASYPIGWCWTWFCISAKLRSLDDYLILIGPLHPRGKSPRDQRPSALIVQQGQSVFYDFLIDIVSLSRCIRAETHPHRTDTSTIRSEGMNR